MKKKAILLSIIIILSFLAGCHGRKETLAFIVPNEFDEAKEYKITFWAKNDTNITQTMIYKNAINSFQKLYPNIEITLRLYTDYGKIYNDVITNIATDTTPNVCITYPDHIATYLTGANTVVPLDELLTDEKFGFSGSNVKYSSPTADAITEKYIDECYYEGHCYALPFMRSSEVCYINKTYVEKLGFTLPKTLTWDFIWTVSDAAIQKDTDGKYIVNGQQVMIPFIYKSTDNMMIQMLKQKGAGYSTQNGNIEIFNEETKSLLYTIANHASQKSFSTFSISGYPANFLNAGQCIFAVDSTAGATWMGTDAPLCDISDDKLQTFETEVMTVPQFDTENIKMISQGPSICVFNKSDSGEVLASWLFAQYLLTNEVQIAYAKTEGYIPVTTTAQKDAGYLSYLEKSGSDNNEYYKTKIDAVELLLNNIDNTFITPVFNGSTSLRNAAGQMIENTVKSVNRKEIINDEYIDELYGNVTSLFRLDQIKPSDSANVKTKFGKLPTVSIILLSTIGFVWVLIILYVFIGNMRKRFKKIY